jgi:signal transduction histidine kinase
VASNSRSAAAHFGTIPLLTDDRPATAPSVGGWLRRCLVYSLLYVAAGALAVVPTQHQVLHSVWLPGGIGLGLLIFCGYASLPFMLVAHLILRLLTGYVWASAWPSAVVAVAQSAFAYALLRRVRFNPTMNTVRDALLLFFWGALIPWTAFCGAAFEFYCLASQPPSEPFVRFCIAYVLRGAIGVVTTAPMILAFAPGRREAWLPARKLEFALTTGLTTATALTVFFRPNFLVHEGYLRSFVPYPFLVWAALRLGLKGASVCIVVLTVCVVRGTSLGHGPFPRMHDLTSVLIVLAYVCMLTVTTILLCASRDERGKLEEMLIEAGELERFRLGTELHDDICQQLSGVGFVGSLLRDRTDLPPSEVKRHLGHVCDEIQRCIKKMTNLARGLAPLGIGTQNLAAALADLALLSEGIYGIECRFQSAGPLPELDRDATTHLFRLTQEAVSNAVKHGKATRIAIFALAEKGRLSLSIADNGIGLFAPVNEHHGLGFKTMAYRTDLMNGSFSVKNQPNSPGVIVACSIPISPTWSRP